MKNHEIVELRQIAAEQEKLIDAIQDRIEVLEASLAAVHGAAQLIQSNIEANQGLLDEADEARLAFILDESGTEEHPPFDGELPEEVKAFLENLVTKGVQGV